MISPFHPMRFPQGISTLNSRLSTLLEEGKGSRRGRAAFSLIEVMVATAILMVVVLMVGSIFTQASSAWDSGYSRAEGGAALRGVAGAMTRDLETAVDMRDFFPNEDAPVAAKNDSLEFVCLKVNDRAPGKSQSDGDAESPREFVHVKYTVTGGKVQRDEWKLVRRWDSSNATFKWEDSGKTTSYPWSGGKSASSASGTGASYEAGFSMTPIKVDNDRYDNRPYKGELAFENNWSSGSGSEVAGMKLRMKLSPSGSFSTLKVVSWGRDGVPNYQSNTQDDIIAF